jgi:N-acetylmuramoyl-L-alanine amidase
MSYRLARISLALALLVAAPLASAADLKGLQLVEDEQGTRALVEVDGLAGYKLFTLANPDRLVVDLADAKLAAGLRLPGPNGLIAGVRTGQPSPGTLRLVFDLGGPVRSESSLDRDGDHARLPLTLARPGSKPAPAQAAAIDPPAAIAQSPAPVAIARAPKPVEYTPPVLAKPAPSRAPLESFRSVPNAIDEPLAVTVEALPPVNGPNLDADEPVAPPKPQALADAPVQAPALVRSAPLTAYAQNARAPAAKSSAQRNNNDAHVAKSMRDVIGSGQRRIVVAIDAGHGGKDPGAHGPSGVNEKNVTLAVARELARQINADPGMRAVLIRDNDSFVPLKQRYMKARAAQADLFISIHADASPNDSANGASVFVLSTRGATSQAARWLADTENAADLVGGVSLDEKDPGLAAVLFDLSQSATMRASDDLANSVLASLKDVGKAHKQGIERANFVVLRSPDVPSMLVETGFITNPGEEQRLNNPNYRNRLASAITSGVRKYFTEQAPPGTWYASRRGDAGGTGGDELVAASPE